MKKLANNFLHPKAVTVPEALLHFVIFQHASRLLKCFSKYGADDTKELSVLAAG